MTNDKLSVTPIGSPSFHIPSIVCPSCRMYNDVTTGVPGVSGELPQNLPANTLLLLVCGGCETAVTYSLNAQIEPIALSAKDETKLLSRETREHVANIRTMVRKMKAAGIWPAPRYAP